MYTSLLTQSEINTTYLIASTGGVVEGDNNLPLRSHCVQMSILPIVEQPNEKFNPDMKFNYAFGKQKIIKIPVGDSHSLPTGTFFKNGQVIDKSEVGDFPSDRIELKLDKFDWLNDFDYNSIESFFNIETLKAQKVFNLKTSVGFEQEVAPR